MGFGSTVCGRAAWTLASSWSVKPSFVGTGKVVGDIGNGHRASEEHERTSGSKRQGMAFVCCIQTVSLPRFGLKFGPSGECRLTGEGPHRGAGEFLTRRGGRRGPGVCRSGGAGAHAARGHDEAAKALRVDRAAVRVMAQKTKTEWNCNDARYQSGTVGRNADFSTIATSHLTWTKRSLNLGRG